MPPVRSRACQPMLWRVLGEALAATASRRPALRRRPRPPARSRSGSRRAPTLATKRGVPPKTCCARCAPPRLPAGRFAQQEGSSKPRGLTQPSFGRATRRPTRAPLAALLPPLPSPRPVQEVLPAEGQLEAGRRVLCGHCAAVLGDGPGQQMSRGGPGSCCLSCLCCVVLLFWAVVQVSRSGVGGCCCAVGPCWCAGPCFLNCL